LPGSRFREALQPSFDLFVFRGRRPKSPLMKSWTCLGVTGGLLREGAAFSKLFAGWMRWTRTRLHLIPKWVRIQMLNYREGASFFRRERAKVRLVRLREHITLNA